MYEANFITTKILIYESGSKISRPTKDKRKHLEILNLFFDIIFL